ncbi:hypothetical protein, partial [Epilithonimonas vandammei]|uniref:hypothetical protein n=1 Tax=Epilithonimonas vandammei TaxID=2487072 RepID=UPI0028A679C5
DFFSFVFRKIKNRKLQKSDFKQSEKKKTVLLRQPLFSFQKKPPLNLKKVNDGQLFLDFA